MKAAKPLALYIKKAPPPFLWRYECQYCRFFIEPDACSIVESGEEGISPKAWCILWFPQQGDAPFSWLSTEKVVNQ